MRVSSYFTDHGPRESPRHRRLKACRRNLDCGSCSPRDFQSSASSAWIRGDRTSRNWKESWSVVMKDSRAPYRIDGTLDAPHDVGHLPPRNDQAASLFASALSRVRPGLHRAATRRCGGGGVPAPQSREAAEVSPRVLGLDLAVSLRCRRAA